MTPEYQAYVARLKLDHRRWLEDPQTQKFFAALEARKRELQDKATQNCANGDGQRIDKHLLGSAEIKTIIDTYATTNQYPYPIPKPGLPDDEDADEIPIPIRRADRQ